MKRRISALLFVLLCGLAPLPLLGGTVYVGPVFVGNHDGLAHDTVLTVTNPTAASQSFTVLFISNFADGTVREEQPLPAMTVPAQSTRVFNGLVPAGSRGTLEITAGDDLAFSAEMTRRRGNGALRRSRVAVVGSQNAIAAGRRFVIQGWGKTANTRTSLALFNLSQATNRCTVNIQGPTGVALPATELVLVPLSVHHWHDALAAVGASGRTDDWIEVRCTGTAYAISQRVETDGAATALPISVDGSSSLRPPIGDDECPPGGVCGTFLEGAEHVSGPGNWTRDLRITGLTGRYARFELELDVFIAQWNFRPGEDVHGVIQIDRGRWRGNLMTYLRFKNSQLRTSTSIDGSFTSRDVNPGDFIQTGRWYHVKVVYDATNADGDGKSLTFEWTDDRGRTFNHLGTVVTGRNVLDFPSSAGSQARILLGFPAHAPEASNRNWRWANVRYRVTPL